MGSMQAHERVLLTGATGFIGARVMQRLAAESVELHCVTRRPVPDGPDNGVAGVNWHQADLTVAGEVTDVVASIGPTTIVHLAGAVTGTREAAEIHPIFEQNLVATMHLLEAARSSGVDRILIAGSLEEPETVGETPASPYAASKAGTRMFGNLYRASTDLEVVHLQIFMVYGPGQRDEKKLVPYLITSLLDGQHVETSSGTRLVDWVFIDDVVEGIVRCMRVEQAPEVPVPLGTGRLSSVAEVVATIHRLVGSSVDGSGLGTLGDRSREVEVVANVDLTRELLGWAPGELLEDGLRKTIDHYRGVRADGAQEPEL